MYSVLRFVRLLRVLQAGESIVFPRKLLIQRDWLTGLIRCDGVLLAVRWRAALETEHSVEERPRQKIY